MLKTPTYAYRSDRVDLLRAGLAIVVMLMHAVPWAQLAQGADAVPALLVIAKQSAVRLFQNAGETNPDVLAFIVLSGYCIHRNGLREGHVDVGQFAIRRVFRIYPVYVLAIAVGVALWAFSVATSPALAKLLSGTSDIGTGCTLARLTGLAALYPIRCPLGNAPLDTVMAEIWLYIAYPPLFLVMLRLGEAKLWQGLALLWLAAVAWLSLAGASGEPWSWWNNSSLVGFLVYWWIGAKALDPAFQAKLKAAFPLLIGLWLTLSIPLVVFSDGIILLVESRKVVFALLIALLIVRLDTAVRTHHLLALLGRSGYSLYAFHAPIIYTLLILAWPWWGAVLAAIAFGIMGHLVIEQPP